MDFKACCFFGQRPRSPQLINLMIIVRRMIIRIIAIIITNIITFSVAIFIFRHLLYMSNYPTAHLRCHLPANLCTFSIDKLGGREGVHASTGKTVATLVFMAFLCSGKGIIREIMKCFSFAKGVIAKKLKRNIRKL